MFAIAEFLAGVGVTFRTGSDSALIFDSLLTKEKDPNGRYGRIMANRMSAMFIGGAVGAIIGGYIASWGFLRLPIFIAVFGHAFFAFLVYLGYTEAPRIKAKSPKSAIQTAVKSLTTKKELQLVLFGVVSALALTRIGFWASQHALVNDYSVDTIGMGFIIASFNICAGLTSFLIKRMFSRFANLNSLLIILVLDGFYLLALIPVSSITNLILVSFVGQITRGSRTPIIQCISQENLASVERATFNSVLSLIGSFAYVILSGLINILNLSRQEALLVGLLGVLISLGFFLRILVGNYRVKIDNAEVTLH
jgi:MFS family permease